MMMMKVHLLHCSISHLTRARLMLDEDAGCQSYYYVLHGALMGRFGPDQRY
jgi:hypothetical protein